MVASLPTSRRSSGLAPRELHESSRLLRDPFLRIADEEHGATTGSGESTDQQALDVARASHLRTLMDIRLKPLREQGVVITGASSGIGLVTAKRAAKADARVVLAARNEHDLASAVASIREDGGRALALRMELEQAGLPISVTLVKPSSIDTPLFEKSRSLIGTEPQPIPPVYAPEVVARVILAAAERPIRDVIAGGMGKVVSLGEKLSPRLTDKVHGAKHVRFTEDRHAARERGRQPLRAARA